MKKITASVLCLVMLLTVFPVNAFADDWDGYFDDYRETKGSVLLNPGSDDTEMNFSWYSAFGGRNCRVLISENADMSDAVSFSGKTLPVPEGDLVNKVTVTGLREGTTYYYVCKSTNSESPVGSFTTVKDNTFSALYVTDIHVTCDDYEDSLKTEAGKVDELLREACEKRDLKLVISAGDQASNGLRTEYISLMASPLWSSLPFALCAGNHDRKGFDYRYFNNNPNQYRYGVSSYIANDYWYVKGDVLFLVFDSNCYAAETHRAFALDAVKKNPGVKWKVAAFHHDMYGVMSQKRLDFSEDYLRPGLGEILDEIGVDIAFTGHTHHYTISNPIYGGLSTESIAGKSSVTDPEGTVYIVSGSVNHPRGEESARGDVIGENIGYMYLSDEILYNIVDFTQDSITVSAYALGSDTPVNSFTVYKTDENGGHPGYERDADGFFKNLSLQFLAFFEEFGITVKVLFKTFEILKMQGVANGVC